MLLQEPSEPKEGNLALPSRNAPWVLIEPTPDGHAAPRRASPSPWEPLRIPAVRIRRLRLRGLSRAAQRQQSWGSSARVVRRAPLRKYSLAVKVTFG